MRSDSDVGPIRALPVLPWLTSIALLVLMLAPAICVAHRFSVTECTEGGDFIKNAALARDGGISESRFIDKIHEDILVIQGLPPQLRWFVQDEEDAEFLLTAATNVFQNPKEAGAHQMDFVSACLGKMDGKVSYQL